MNISTTGQRFDQQLLKDRVEMNTKRDEQSARSFSLCHVNIVGGHEGRPSGTLIEYQHQIN